MKSYVFSGCCMALLLAGMAGCSSEPAKTGGEQLQASETDLRDTLRSAVQDDGRLQQMLALVEQNAAQIKTGIEELEKLRKEEVQLNANDSASRDAFRQLGDRIQHVREEYRSKVIKLRTALAQLATDEEWKKITSRDLALFNS